MDKNLQFFKNYIAAHQSALDHLWTDTSEGFKIWVDQAVRTLQSGHKILFCGNGGSAAEAQHIAAELSVKFYHDRKPLAALALHADSSALTAAGNDYGFDHVFSRQVMALGNLGDMLVAYSTSGKSKNILAALEQARKQKLYTVGLTGQQGATMKSQTDVCLIAPSAITAHIQEMHTILGHAFCAAIEDNLNLVPFEKNPWPI